MPTGPFDVTRDGEPLGRFTTDEINEAMKTGFLRLTDDCVDLATDSHCTVSDVTEPPAKLKLQQRSQVGAAEPAPFLPPPPPVEEPTADMTAPIAPLPPPDSRRREPRGLASITPPPPPDGARVTVTTPTSNHRRTTYIVAAVFAFAASAVILYLALGDDRDATAAPDSTANGVANNVGSSETSTNGSESQRQDLQAQIRLADVAITNAIETRFEQEAATGGGATWYRPHNVEGVVRGLPKSQAPTTVLRAAVSSTGAVFIQSYYQGEAGLCHDRVVLSLGSRMLTSRVAMGNDVARDNLANGRAGESCMFLDPQDGEMAQAIVSEIKDGGIVTYRLEGNDRRVEGRVSDLEYRGLRDAVALSRMIGARCRLQERLAKLGG